MSAQQSEETGDAQKVAVEVDGTPIFVSDVNQLANQFPNQDPDRKAAQQAVALEQLIHRRLICNYLKSLNIAATKSEIDLQQESLEIQLGQRDQTLEQFLNDRNVKLESLRQQWEWQIGWQRYLERQLSDENLEKFFNQRKREFDGTKIRVSQILITVDEQAAPQEWEKAEAKCKAIRTDITNKKITWNEAVKEYSQAPSAAEDGDAGWIGFDGPMPQKYSEAVFKLEPDQISQPVTTAFGVHLLKISEIKAGKSSWRDAKIQLKKSATKFLFDWIVQKQLQESKVEFKENSPYFELASGKLVIPEK